MSLLCLVGDHADALAEGMAPMLRSLLDGHVRAPEIVLVSHRSSESAADGNVLESCPQRLLLPTPSGAIAQGGLPDRRQAFDAATFAVLKARLFEIEEASVPCCERGEDSPAVTLYIAHLEDAAATAALSFLLQERASSPDRRRAVVLFAGSYVPRGLGATLYATLQEIVALAGDREDSSAASTAVPIYLQHQRAEIDQAEVAECAAVLAAILADVRTRDPWPGAGPALREACRSRRRAPEAAL